MSLLPFFPGFEDDVLTAALRNFPGASAHAVAQSEGNTKHWVRGMPIDIKETDKDFQLTADIPGVSKQDIKINVSGDVLSLSVEQSAGKEEEKEENGVKYHRMERSSTFARRAIRMPETADLSKITARYQDGVLSLKANKHEQQMPKNRQITIE
ncbi:hypothetical protein WJX72_002344 [[Myrmecia] bisecta]|uniref:SHSP domain-containing protein n=1 Tax=[Myrmecia] bisecta TaxID=41462 RepID=A0AAW1R528_9CHLO